MDGNVWLSSRLEKLSGFSGPIIFSCNLDYGVSHLIAKLDDQFRPLIWIELTPTDKNDVIAQGNKLADAVKKRLGDPLLPHALPYAYGMKALKHYLGFLGPFTFVLTGAENGPEFAQDLLSLHTMDSRVVLAFDQLDNSFKIPDAARVLDAKDLALTEEEASELAGEDLSHIYLDTLERSQHAYDRFLSLLDEQRNTLPHLIPGPVGPRFAPHQTPHANPNILLKVLIKKKRWLEVLELAVKHFPNEVPGILEEAGHAYHERGLHKRMWDLLSSLPTEVKNKEIVLFRLLSSAFRLGKAEIMRKDVETYLAENEASELRALYAGILARPETRLKEITRAFQAKKSIFIYYQYGRMAPNIDEALNILTEATSLTEHVGRSYEVARNAGALASRLAHKGKYGAACHWAEYALKWFDDHGITDGQRRLQIVNHWAYARILTGKLAGLEDILKEGEEFLDQAHPFLARLFRSTLGDYLLAIGRPAEALLHFRKIHEESKRSWLGNSGLNLVRTLLELSEFTEALDLAEKVYDLTENETPSLHAPAALAYGMAQVFLDPRAAIPILKKAQRLYLKNFSAHHLASIGLYQAKAFLMLKRESDARSSLQNVSSCLSELAPSGLRLLSGPEEMLRDVWSMLDEQTSPLEFQLLGTTNVWLNNKRLNLYPTEIEVLAVLALKPTPLSLEALLIELRGDGGSKDAIKTTLSKLRKQIPVSRNPYKLEIPFKADFLELLAKVRERNFGDAIALYNGPLLPDSDAPAIREADELITEALRQGVLESNDSEVLFAYSEKFPDDLEVLEKACLNLNKKDPRYPLVQARAIQTHFSWSQLITENQ